MNLVGEIGPKTLTRKLPRCPWKQCNCRQRAESNRPRVWQ